MGKAEIISLILRTINREYLGQLDYYAEMKDLCLQQKEAGIAKDYDRLELLLTRRMQILTTLEKENAKLKPIREEVARSLELEKFHIGRILEKFESDNGRELEQTFIRLRRLLEEIKELDKENEFILRQDLAADGFQSSPGQAIQAYKRNMIDKKG